MPSGKSIVFIKVTIFNNGITDYIIVVLIRTAWYLIVILVLVSYKLRLPRGAQSRNQPIICDRLYTNITCQLLRGFSMSSIQTRYNYRNKIYTPCFVLMNSTWPLIFTNCLLACYMQLSTNRKQTNDHDVIIQFISDATLYTVNN